VPLGAATVTFAAGVNSSLQLAVEPAMRGRVMALYSVVFLGSTPIGAPAVGWLTEVAGPRSGLVAGAVAAAVAAVLAQLAFARTSAGEDGRGSAAAARRGRRPRARHADGRVARAARVPWAVVTRRGRAAGEGAARRSGRAGADGRAHGARVHAPPRHAGPTSKRRQGERHD
jgi:MFS family permease